MKWLIPSLLLFSSITYAQTPFKGADYLFYYQVNVGKTNGTSTASSAWLEIGKDSTTKGMRVPRVVDTSSVTSPVFGLVIYRITDNTLYVRDKFGWRKIADATTLNNYLLKSDSATLYYPRQSNPKNYVINELDPVANAKTIRWIPGAGIRVSNSSPQALSTNPSDSIVAKVDSAIWNANRLQTAPISATPPTSGQILQYNGSQYVPVTFGGGGGGSVTSVGLSLPSIFTVTNSPVITSGILTGTFNNQFANLILASPNGISGQPSFRSMANGDLPTTAVTSGTYGNDTAFSIITVNSKGVLTSAGAFPLTLDRTLRGGNSTGRNIEFTDTSQISWIKNSDYASIKYSSTGDFNNSSNLVFTMGDNSYFFDPGTIEGFIFRKDTASTAGVTPIYDSIVYITDQFFKISQKGSSLLPLFYANRLTNKVGIGTAAPSEALQVVGNLVAAAPAYSTGGITTLGRNNTTGRFETFTATPTGPATLKTFNTNATGADTLYAYTVPSAYLANSGDMIKATYAGFFAATGATDHTVGVANGVSLSNGTTSGGTWEIEMTIIRVNNTTIRSTTRIEFDNTGVTTSLYRQFSGELTGLNLSANGLRLGLLIGSPNVNVTAQLGTVIYYPGAP